MIAWFPSKLGQKGEYMQPLWRHRQKTPNPKRKNF